MRKANEALWPWMINRLRTHFLAGILVVVPIAAAILILVWVFNTIDNILQPIIQLIIGRHIIGLGFALTLVLIYVTGIVAGNYLGKKLIRFADSLLQHVPVFRQIYSGAKQVIESVSGTGAISKTAFREVVLVEFPAKGMRTVAFVTNEFIDESGGKLYAIYVPTSPVPSSGFSGIVTPEQITRTDITVDEALKMVISGVLIAPEHIELQVGDQTKTFRSGSKPGHKRKSPAV